MGRGNKKTRNQRRNNSSLKRGVVRGGEEGKGRDCGGRGRVIESREKDREEREGE